MGSMHLVVPDFCRRRRKGKFTGENIAVQLTARRTSETVNLPSFPIFFVPGKVTVKLLLQLTVNIRGITMTEVFPHQIL